MTFPTPADEGGRNQVAKKTMGCSGQDLRDSIVMGSLVGSGAGGCTGLLSPPTPCPQQPLDPSGCLASHVQWWHF